MTPYAKAITALLTGIAQIAALYGLDLGLSEDVIVSVAAVAAPILVYAIPNRSA